jgi:O-antigen ligase
MCKASAGRGTRWPLLLGLWAVPASIAISETFLSIAALIRIIRIVRRQAQLRLPRCLWLWAVWAGLECALWVISPEPALGWSEIRHLLLLGVVFVTLTGLERTADRLMAWRGVFVVATLSSAYLIGEFFFRLFTYAPEIAAGGDAGFYLRSGGLVHHWMIYATIEVAVFAGLLSFWSEYPEERRRWWPVYIINIAAIVLSLTRMAWITCFLLFAVHLAWKRSRWILALPLVPLLFYAVSPAAVWSRAAGLADLTYYSNAERLQMLEVGWKMIRDYPLTGVGPGRVEKLYRTYLTAGDNVPAYHGHLHNNIAQIAAQFGIPVLLAAALFTAVLFRDLLRARRAAANRDARFLADAAALALSGFLVAGLFEYTYGHSLGLIMISFAVLPALLPHQR